MNKVLRFLPLGLLTSQRFTIHIIGTKIFGFHKDLKTALRQGSLVQSFK